MIVRASKGEVTLYKIAKGFIVEPHSISGLLARMERDELIKRRVRGDSRKSLKIELTEKGTEVCRELAKLETLRKIAASISEEQEDQIVSTLRILRDTALKQMRMEVSYPSHHSN